MNGLQIINLTLEFIGGISIGYLIAKWYWYHPCTSGCQKESEEINRTVR